MSVTPPPTGESFLNTVKTDSVTHCDYRTRDQARPHLSDHVGVLYNRERQHSTINYEAPLIFEAAQANS